MRMPFLPTRFHPSITSSRPRSRGFLLGLVAGATCLGTSMLSAQSDAEISQLRAQMQQMQQDYEKRLATMEGQMKSMEAQVALTASVARSRTLTGPDGKAIAMEGPVVLPDITTFTRNLKTHGYIRVGTGFTGNGVGQTSSFQMPSVGHGRFRLGNENDTYIEWGPILTHMLGDDPDAMDVSFKMTFQLISGEDKQSGVNLDNAGWNIGLVEAYLEFKNVIKSAPEVTFWGGERFYDRYNIDPQDYFFLNTSGVGGGVYNIDLGIGSLAIAYFGGIRAGTGSFWLDDTSFNRYNLQVNGGQGDFYKHVLDIRLGDIDFLAGKLKMVLIGAYQHGGDFTITNANGTTGNAHVDNSGGVGGGLVQQWDLPQMGKLSFIQAAALYGYGLVDFDPSGVDLNKLGNSYNSAIAQSGSAYGTFKDVDPYNNSQRARANIFWVWNPTDNFSMGTWATYQFDDQGFTTYQTNANGSVTSASPYAHLFTAGVRPVFWLWGPFCIQGQAGYSYLSNNRGPGAATGDGGSLGIFTIAPTIKPRSGGYFSRPELRLYATYAVWSDALKGSIGGPYYANQNMGWNFGIQAEAWW
ncbi:MAG TPA: carbohydrate porin [Terrimicrobiaceae bacterium]